MGARAGQSLDGRRGRKPPPKIKYILSLAGWGQPERSSMRLWWAKFKLRKAYKKLVGMEQSMEQNLDCGVALSYYLHPSLEKQRQVVSKLYQRCLKVEKQ